MLADRALVRTWAMRGTLHLLAVEDARWIVPLLTSLLPAPLRRMAQLDVDPERATTAVERALRDGPRSRAELGEALGREGQALIHTIAAAARAGVCVYDEGDTFILAADRVGDWEPREPAEALHELARRYAAAHAEATLEDFAAWSGLPAKAAREGWAAGGDAPPRADDPGAAPHDSVRLLGAYDPYLLGWRRRDHVVAPEHARRVHPGGGVVRPVILQDGRAVGTWSAQRRGDALAVDCDFFADPLDVTAEADDVARFRSGKPDRVRLVSR